ncbi:MAG: reverse transcriptase family protein [Pseudomonadota bacterium]
MSKQINVLYHNIASSDGDLSVEKRWFLIKNAILVSAHQAIPVRIVKPSKRTCFLWRYAEIRNILNQKYKIYKKYKNSNDPKHKEIIRKNQTNAKKAIRRIKMEIENYIAESATDRPKIFWRHVRDKLKAPAVVPKIQKPDVSLSCDDYETACVLNDFFVSVFTAEPDASNLRFSRSFDCSSKLSYITITPHDIVTVINRLKKDASPGPDGISNRLIIEGRTALTNVLADFFNYLLCKGFLPSDWKDANITPIHNSGSFAYPNNYRPISLTSSICKIFERIIHRKILSYLDENDLLASSQHGFLPRKSCLTAQLDCFESITKFLDSDMPVDMIYIDFRKAFDSVPHQRLLAKLSHYGISGSLIDLVSSFLTGRRQRVALRNEYSDWLPVKSGVPQGSVLGPLFFLLYINDIDNSLPKCNIIKFADDIKIFSVVSDSSLQHVINNIATWASHWLLEIHPNKCNVIHFGYNNNKINYWLDNVSINQVKHVKDLGIYVDEDLKWSQHCTRVARRAHRLLTIIKKSFTSRCPTIMLKLYKAHLLPIFDYLSPIWSPYLKVKKRSCHIRKSAKAFYPFFL